jgi:ParB/RepB/Spo0J family partition protein
MILRETPLDQIDFSDQTFTFSYFNSVTALEQSIQQVGLLHPVFLQERPGSESVRIVSGLKRLQALKNLGYRQVSAQIYDVREQDDFEIFRVHLSENASFRQFNEVERARIIDKLINPFQIPSAKVSRDFLPLIGLGTNPKVIERYLPLVRLPENIQSALAADVIGVEMATEMGRLAGADQTLFFNLCLNLKLGKNRQRELFNLFQDLARMSGSSLTGVAEKIQLEKILGEEIPTPVQTERVKLALKQLRFPRLTEVEENFKQILKKFKLPPQLSLAPYPFFEEAQFTIKFDFRDRAELEKRIAVLRRISQNPAIADLEKLT